MARDGPKRLAIETLVDAQGALPGDRILAVFDHLEQWLATPAYHGCPFNNAVAEQAGTEAAAIARRHKAALSTWLSDQAQLGGAPSPTQVGAQLLVLVDGALNGAAIFGSPEPARAARGAAEVLLANAGIATSKARRRSAIAPAGC